MRGALLIVRINYGARSIKLILQLGLASAARYGNICSDKVNEKNGNNEEK